MNIDELREQIPDEPQCRKFFDNLIRSEGRRCPHCQCSRGALAVGLDFMNVADVRGSLLLPPRH